MVCSAVEFSAISPHLEKYKFNSSRVFAETGFFLPVPKHTFHQHMSRWHQYFLPVLPLDCAVVDIHSAHIFYRCCSEERRDLLCS